MCSKMGLVSQCESVCMWVFRKTQFSSTASPLLYDAQQFSLNPSLKTCSDNHWCVHVDVYGYLCNNVCTDSGTARQITLRRVILRMWIITSKYTTCCTVTRCEWKKKKKKLIGHQAWKSPATKNILGKFTAFTCHLLLLQCSHVADNKKKGRCLQLNMMGEL